MSARILVLPGSTRLGSHNRRLALEAARLLALGNATVTMVDLADYPMPIYDGDLEERSGPPEMAVKLAERIAAQDGMLLVSPEYNASVPPLLKNALDWVSRVRKVEGRPLQPFRRLVVALASASPGRLGGLRGLMALRPICQSVGAEVLTTQLAVHEAATAFDENGRLQDERQRLALEALLEQLTDYAQALGRNQS